MEVAGCISLLQQLSYTFSPPTPICRIFPQTNLFYVSFNFLPPFHPQSVLFTFSINFMHHYFHQNIFLTSPQNITIPPHTIRPFQLICCFLQSQHVHQFPCIPFVHQLYTVRRPHHRSFCSSQNSYLIFSQTPRFASI